MVLLLEALVKTLPVLAVSEKVNGVTPESASDAPTCLRGVVNCGREAVSGRTFRVVTSRIEFTSPVK